MNEAKTALTNTGSVNFFTPRNKCSRKLPVADLYTQYIYNFHKTEKPSSYYYKIIVSNVVFHIRV